MVKKYRIWVTSDVAIRKANQKQKQDNFWSDHNVMYLGRGSFDKCMCSCQTHLMVHLRFGHLLYIDFTFKK